MLQSHVAFVFPLRCLDLHNVLAIFFLNIYIYRDKIPFKRQLYILRALNMQQYRSGWQKGLWLWRFKKLTDISHLNISPRNEAEYYTLWNSLSLAKYRTYQESEIEKYLRILFKQMHTQTFIRHIFWHRVVCCSFSSLQFDFTKLDVHYFNG